MRHDNRPSYFKQKGVATVEFALIASLLFSLLFGVIEMGRILYYMNSAAEATRLGARVAVVCDMIDPKKPADPTLKAITTRMQSMLPILAPSNIKIDYFPKKSLCTQATCESVKVTINLTVNTFIPFIPFTLNMPPYSTTLPRESLSSTGYGNNALCS